MSDIISNQLTGQGTDKDVNVLFEIKDILSKPLTSYQLRSLVASDHYCEKVVSYLPKCMGNVMSRKLEVAIRQRKRSRNVSDVSSWINENIRELSPWFVEAQKEANIVGKSYLLIHVDYERFPQDSPYYNFPFLHPIDWGRDSIEYGGIRSVSGDRVLGGDVWEWSKGKEYLVKRYVSIINANESNVLGWIDSKSKVYEDYQYDIVHKSHVLEFTSFDYQDDSEYLRLQKPNLGYQYDKRIYYGVSFTLTRFVNVLLRYLSFTNATLNRMHRSESILYKKENLGETNQAIARYISQTSDSKLIPDVNLVISEELSRLEKSLRNFGVALIDKKNDIEMIHRTMSGVSELDVKFSKDLVAASKLTEFSLFGVTTQGAGLANMDVRDRAAISKTTDELVSEHWSPLILYVARCLALASGKINNDTHTIYINQQNSFELSEFEVSEWLEKRIKVLLDLLDRGIIDDEVVRRELADNTNLGRYFNFTENDIERLRSSPKSSST